jgi:hypothetical protein
MPKFVKLKNKSKKEKKIIIDGACDNKITAYVKEEHTGALIPVTTEAVKRMRNGETLSIEEAERLHDRFYFKLPALAIRWGIDKKELLGKIIELKIPSFFNPNEVKINGNEALVGQDDVCVFKEYVDALEKKLIKMKKDIKPDYIGNGKYNRSYQVNE